MKERDLWDNPEKAGSAGYLKTSRTEETARKKSRKEDWGKKKRLENFGDSN
jgi:hypothetical protein